MANKVYTAQEMREAANVVDDVSVNDYGEYFYEKDDKFNPDIVRDMLRQAAEEMESKRNAQEKAGDCDEMIDSFAEIYNIANDSDEQNWRSCMEKIQDITRRFV